MWHYRLDFEAVWYPVKIPSVWEEKHIPKDYPGPVWFRTTLSFPAIDPERRYWLRFHGVSYHCHIFVNDHLAGEHTGTWDVFSIEITSFLRTSSPSNRDADILVRVTKPASLTAGPDSPHVVGEFPLRETLSGFLPYVWGHAFGGIWQPVELYTTGASYIQDAFIRGDSEGRLYLQVTLSSSVALRLQILDPSGQVLFSTTFPPSLIIDNSQCTIDNFLPWSPACPTLYTARLTIENGDEKILRFGFRTLSTGQSVLLLNDQPIYPRLVLSWGWYSEQICPDPGPVRVRSDFARLKALGFNGVKLCLWFPPPYIFDLADELGMLLWVEFPIWLPMLTDFFRAQAPLELERLARLARQHPSVIWYTLGCELGSTVDAEFLELLYQRIKPLLADALLTSNSGSGEAYNGPLGEAADFYDHHFYTDPTFLPGLLDAFAPQWRASKPWLMGEFCDADTLRNWAPFLDASSGSPVPTFWWLTDTPQGARWTMEVYEQAGRLKELGLWEQMGELEQLSLQKALLHRKLTVETVRARPALSGYVITGEVDTPISTSGMWDDFGNEKFDPLSFRQFNADVVPLLGFRRWREWQAGGDRPVYSDRFCYRSGEEVRIALLVSHFGQYSGKIAYDWEIGYESALPFAKGAGRTEQEIAPAPGQVCEIGLIRFNVPEVKIPRRCVLRVVTACDENEPPKTHQNEWTFWLFPGEIWDDVRPFTLIDPPRRLGDLAEYAPALCKETLDETQVVVCTVWSPEIAQFVEQGGRAILLQGKEPGPLRTVPRPFWRECMQVGVPHPAWGGFPYGFGIQYYALGTDLALVTSPGQSVSLLRRLDTRQILMEDYAVLMEMGRGQVIITTLRLEGGLGDQPSGIMRSPAGLYLLAEWLRYLQDD